MGAGKIAQGYEHVLLRQRFQVQFPAPTEGRSQLPVTPTPEDPIHSSGLHQHQHSHMHMPTNRNIHTYT